MKLSAELCALIERHAAPHGRRTITPIPQLMIRSATAPEPVRSLSIPMLSVIAMGSSRVMLGDRTFDYRVGQYLIMSADLPTTNIISASAESPFMSMAFELRPSAIADILIEAGSDEGMKAEVAGISIGEVTPALLSPLIRLVRLLDSPSDIPILVKVMEREILWRLITGESGGMVRQIGLADSRLSQVGKGIRWIRDHYAEAFRIEDVAQMCGMSIAAFHRHFRAVTAMSPLQYQKQIRLQEARTRIISEPQNIAAIGLAVGYDSPSHFSRDYRRQFGAPPSKDSLRRPRRASIAKKLN